MKTKDHITMIELPKRTRKSDEATIYKIIRHQYKLNFYFRLGFDKNYCDIGAGYNFYHAFNTEKKIFQN